MVIDPSNSNFNKGGVNTSTSSASRGKAASVGGSPSQPAPTKGADQPTDTVSLSGQAKSLGKLESEIAKEPSVNQAKVEAIKSAIENGSYQVDAAKVAEGMLNQDQAF